MNKEIKYYTNAHGIELAEHLEGKMAIEWYNFCILNAVKYRVRAGNKENNSYDGDWFKSMDYVQRASNVFPNGAYDDIDRYVDALVWRFSIAK